jgi:serine/threonine-protein kinase
MPGTAPLSGTATALDRIARHRHAAEVMRARSVILVACALYLVVGAGLDILAHPTLGHGSLAFSLGVRALAVAYHAALLVLLYRSPPPPASLTGPMIDAVFPLTSLDLAVIATQMGGITSPYVTGVFVILMVQALATPRPWQRGAPLAAATMLLWPAVMLTAAMIDDTVRAQLDDPVQVAGFATHVAVLLAAAIVITWGGHVIYSLRQSVFESRNLGRYKLTRRIGKGGMGEVWRAEDRALRRDVALKVLSPEQGKNPASIARFEREIQATAELNHPNVVRIHDWGVTDDGVWYYAMELLDGVDLASLVRRGGPLPPALVVHLGVQAARGLAEAHAHGVIHRDVKPANLVVTPGAPGELEEAKLLDFGVARLDGDDAGLTIAGAVIGTPGYIAPEVIAGAPGGVLADVYGLAATLFFALTGKTPRDAGAGVPPSALVAGIPVDLDDALIRALDADPGRRQRGADELGIELGASTLAGTWTGGLPADRIAPEIETSGEQPALDATVDAEAPVTRSEGPARAKAR